MCFLTILCYLPDKKMATTNKNNKEVKVPIQNEEEDKNNMSSFNRLVFNPSINTNTILCPC